ncbi:MAG: anaerobic sulfatase maturase [Spirochaetales bacterium]|nr:anaerobic sulfatase maturase [Spirochaetales bacterium]
MQEVTGTTRKAAHQFQIFVKPVGAICNLACDYCYYLPKKALYPDGASHRMPEDLLEAYITQHIDAHPGPVVNFSWHGGEPTLSGLDYFRNIVSLQRKHKPHGYTITNNVQSNGILIDEAWCRFFSEERFSVGLSLDGPADLHDAYRHTADGRSTHKQAMRAYRLLRRHSVPCDILCVVNALNVRHPSRVYRFFKEMGAEYLGFIPLVEPLAAGGLAEPTDGAPVSDRSVPAEAWGDFLVAIFDEWLARDIGKIQVQIVEEVARAGLGHPHALCIFREKCGDIPVIEHNGDFYSCDHFVDPEHRVGNLRQTPLIDLIEHPAQRAFGNAKSELLPRYCRECNVLDMCYGGCPKDRIISAPDGEPGLNYLCEGYKRFFTRCRPFAEQLAVQSRRQSSEAQSRQPIEPRTPQPGAAHNRPAPKVGRNDPCPCGSGRKYKHCCMRR